MRERTRKRLMWATVVYIVLSAVVLTVINYDGPKHALAVAFPIVAATWLLLLIVGLSTRPKRR